MLKRLAIGAGAVGLLLGAAAPALANGWGGHWWGDWGHNQGSLLVSNTNGAVVTTGATANANTGYNAQNDTAQGGGTNTGDAKGDDTMRTGEAQAVADSQALVNKNATYFDVDCGCYKDVEVTNHNHAWVRTTAGASANTGHNAQNDTAYGGGTNTGNASGDDWMSTGFAGALATAASWVNINRTLVGGSL